MPFNPELFLSTLALIGVVIVISALLSGFIEKSGLPQVAVFLGLGAAIGPFGLNLMNADLHSPILRVVATLSLVLVLFTDAVSLNISEVRQNTLVSCSRPRDCFFRNSDCVILLVAFGSKTGGSPDLRRCARIYRSGYAARPPQKAGYQD